MKSDFVQTLTFLHPREIAEHYSREEKPTHSHRWILRNEIKPADLYCYLGARFGQPNGFSNFLRSNDTDNLIHWDWTLQSALGILTILGMNFRTEVWIAGEEPIDDSWRDELIRQIKTDFSTHGAQMSKVRKALESWVEFVNPYRRLRSSVQQFVAQLTALGLDPLDTSTIEFLHSDTNREKWNEVVPKYSQAAGLAFGIRAMLPVMGEAFVNLLLYILQKPDIRNDGRLRDNAFRQPIDIRIKSLHITCDGFAKAVDYASPTCAKYHSLVNERNDLLHGNVVIEKLKFNELYFWGTVPVFKEYRSTWERTIGVGLEMVGFDKVREELETVDNFIAYLLGCLKEELRPGVEVALDARDLGYCKNDGRVGVLFGRWLVDIVPPIAGDKDP